MKIILALIAMLPLSAQAGRIVNLGETALQTDQLNQVQIPTCRFYGEKLAAIQLKIKGDMARIDRLIFNFSNGEVEVVRIKKIFRQNSATQWIALGTTNRCLKTLNIIGNEINRSVRETTVQVLGAGVR